MEVKDKIENLVIIRSNDVMPTRMSAGSLQSP